MSSRETVRQGFGAYHRIRRRGAEATTGAPQLPGFDDSLRLLVESERYSLTDVGMMFGVGVERVRQWCERRGIRQPSNVVGTRKALRVWDDTAHRFLPVPRGLYHAAERRTATLARKAARIERRLATRARIVGIVATLRAAKGREPTWSEILLALGDTNPVHHEDACMFVVAKWGRSRQTVAEVLVDLKVACGISSILRGGLAHKKRLSSEGTR